MKKIATSFLLATAAIITAGCEQESAPVASASSRTSDRVPVHLKLGDGTMMRVTQIGWRAHFYKTAQGYAEYGAEASVAGVGGGVDWSKGHVYAELNYLEALALVDNDWTKIHDAVVRQEKTVSNSVQANLVEMTLKPLVTEGKNLVTVQPFWYESKEAQDAALANPKVLEDPQFVVIGLNYDFDNEPVYIRLPDWNLLRISEHCSSTKGKSGVYFHVTSSGYGVFGLKASVKVISGGFEVPTNNLYNSITPLEAIAFVDGDKEKIYEAVLRQSRIILGSVDPKEVRKALSTPDFSKEAVPNNPKAEPFPIRPENSFR